MHHITIWPLDRLVAVYENVMEIVFDQRETTPNHFTFIAGPIMTADIQGSPFKGVPGPSKLEVILIE